MRSIFSLILALAAAGCATAPPLSNHGRPDRPHGSPRSWGGGRATLFISPVGEPFRGAPGVTDPSRAWFDGADKDGDGRLTLAEFTADAARFFDVLDRSHDGEIDPDDIAFYENTLVPEIRSGSGDGAMRRGTGGERSGQGRGGRRGGGGMSGGGGRGRGRGGQGAGGTSDGSARSGGDAAGKQGAARFGWFDFPEPITAMDRNFNRGVDRDEMARAATERFHILDRNADGVLERGELPHLSPRAAPTATDQRSVRPARRDEEAQPDSE